jgi:predicted ATPase
VAAALDAMAGDGGDVVAAEQLCDELARRQRFLEPRGVSDWPDGTAATHYRFVHQLNHSVAYERIPAARRARMHRALALRMESAWGPRASEEAVTLAVHFEYGRDWRNAVRHLRHAALSATRQYAHRESVRHLRKALSLLDKLPPHERGEHELPILMSLGVSLQVTDGFAAPEYKQVYDRALALADAGGRSVHETFPVLWGIWMFNKVRSDLRQADEIARRLLALAREADDPCILIQAHQAMCLTNLCLGRLPESVEHMGEVIALYDPARVANNAEVYGQDPGVATMSFGAVALWMMGRTDESLQTHRRAMELANQLRRPSTLALAKYFAAMLHQLRGDAAAARQAAEETIALAAEDGFTFWHAGGTILRGWARAMTGEGESGIAELRRGIDAWRDTGSRTYSTYHQGLLAEALLTNDRCAEARNVLDEALTAAREMPEGIYLPQLSRLKDLAQSRE